MPSTTQRYPLSTSDGDWIPLDVMKSNGLIIKTISTTVSSSITIDDSIEIIRFLATEDCIVRFGGIASLGTDGVVQPNTIFLPKSTPLIYAPTSNTFTVISISTGGILYAQLIDKWAGLALQTQYTRR